MKPKLNYRTFSIIIALFLAAGAFAEDTNSGTAITRDESEKYYLLIQEQIHATGIALQESQDAAMQASQSNSLSLSQRLQSLEKTVAQQQDNANKDARKTQLYALIMAGAFGLIGLGIMLLMVYFQWRAFTQLAQISAGQQTAIASRDGVHQLAAPGRATVEASTAQLLSAVGRLEQRINELESGQRLLPEIATVKSADLLAEGQKQLDANSPLKALECFDKFLASEPNRADAMVKRGAALEKLGRDDEALAVYNRAIAADNTLIIAHLHKGGLLNRLRRYDEALNCYEQALLGQEKKGKPA